MGKALVICQFVETRIALERCLGELLGPDEVLSVHSFSEAEAKLRSSQRLSYIFIADAYEPLDSASFIETAKASRSAKEATFLLVVNGESQPNYLVANQMVIGFHGFAFTPFSVRSVDDAITLAVGVRKQQSSARLRVAAGLMLSEVFDEERQAEEMRLAEEKSASESTTANDEQSEPPTAETAESAEPTAPSAQVAVPPVPVLKPDIWTRVQESCEEYKQLTGESVTTTVVQEMRLLAPSERVPAYRGASKRVRNLFEQKLRARLKKFGQTRKSAVDR